MQKISQNFVRESDIPNPLIDSMEELMGRKFERMIVAIDQVGYEFIGFKSNDCFISFPLLDMSVCSNVVNRIESSYDKNYRIKLSSFFFGKSHGFETEKSFFIINTSDGYTTYLTTLKSKYRSQINNIKHPFSYSIIWSPCEKDMDLFYNIYIRKMRVLGTLPMPKSFFYGLTGCKDILFLKVFDIEKNCRSVSISIIIKDVLHLIWAASDNKQSSNLFMYKELIKSCCNNDRVKYLNIGRATNNSSQYKFKKRIGGECFPIKEFSGNRALNLQSKLPRYILGMYKVVPLFLIEALSKIIYKRFIR
jgi:hypothetical protein